VDSYPGKTFTGKVESIMAGTGVSFSLFPPENATGNYVKVVQRIPVKIVFDQPVSKDHILRIGMSVEPTVLAK
jgi:membrane fusion protein (multidrug efflux system)